VDALRALLEHFLSLPKQHCRLSGTSVSTQLYAQIIMDGNARWARRRALPVSAGHAQGVEALRRVVAACLEWGIPALTVRGPRTARARASLPPQPGAP
jgi:undecaprenyl pyrophosphate synthase